MNDTIRDLLSMAPGLMAGLKGNGGDAGAFMEGWREAEALDQQRKRQQQQDSLSLQDRQFSQQERERQITRQQTLDAQAAEDRRRSQAIEGLQIPGTLAELGSTADTPEDAQRLIEAAIPNLMSVFGQDTMAYGMPAVEMATRSITGRQKKQVEAYIEKALDTKWVAENPESDPEMELPDHLKRILGKPSAKLSELQSFAELPIGRPQGRPSETPSLQRDNMLVGGKLTPVNYNPKTGTYTDQRGNPVVVDSVPPKVTPPPDSSETTEMAQQLVDGYLVPSMLSRRGNYNSILAAANRLSKAATGKPYNAARAQTEYAAAQRFMSALNGPQQQRFRALAGTVVNTIDEVKALSQEMKNSGVPLLNRAKLMAYTQTMGNTPQGQLAAKYIGAVNTLKEEFANLANGGYAPTEAAWHLANQQINGDFGVQQMDAALTEVQRLINYRMQAFEALTPYGVSPSNPAVQGMGGGGAQGGAPHTPTTPAAPSGAGTPKLRERRKFGDVLGEWNGKEWVEVKP